LDWKLIIIEELSITSDEGTKIMLDQLNKANSEEPTAKSRMVTFYGEGGGVCAIA